MDLEGVRRAQTAAIAALESMLELLRAGGPLTSELLREAALAELERRDAEAETITVVHGSAAADPDATGTGPIAPGTPIVLDVFPRDRASGCFGDVARTVVVGEPPEELVAYHRLCHKALDATARALRAGADGTALTRAAREILHANPYGARHTHALGHGVGREPHERPLLDEGGDLLAAGDVVAVEPGLYRPGFGGCRLEDLFVVTDDGAERIATAPFHLALQ